MAIAPGVIRLIEDIHLLLVLISHQLNHHISNMASRFPADIHFLSGPCGGVGGMVGMLTDVMFFMAQVFDFEPIAGDWNNTWI